ncbi:hypothetical protein [Agrobacterium sp. P15N1-A]|uniref:hypothetical protein n=1 Tax=Agrobacterium sp. P15N1-A TaxID=3342820 RepID=UPI0037CFB48B
MTEWKHELNREQYELLIDSLLRASTVATVIEEMADSLDPATLKEMAVAMRERVTDCLLLGNFEEDDIKAIHKDVMAAMYTKPDA